MQGTVVEDLIKALIGYLEHPVEKHIFLFDSLSNIIKEEFYGKPEGGKALGLQARSQGYFLQKLVHHLHKERNIMLFIAHQTVDLSGMYAQLKPRMGNAVHHNMHNIVRLFLSYSAKEMERDDTKMITSQKVVWTIDKTKQVPSIGSSGHYYILPQEGTIDHNRELIDTAVESGHIERKGAWFNFEDKKWNGLSAIDLSAEDEIKLKELINA
jgi:RecA/RadA recombinase